MFVALRGKHDVFSAHARRPDVFSDDARSSSTSTPEKLVSASDEAKCKVGVVRHRHRQGTAGNQWIRCRKHLRPHCEGCLSKATCVSRECQLKNLVLSGGVQLIAETAW